MKGCLIAPFYFWTFSLWQKWMGSFPLNRLCKDVDLLEINIKYYVCVWRYWPFRSSAKCRLRGLDQWRAIYKVQLSHLDSLRVTGAKTDSIQRVEMCSPAPVLASGLILFCSPRHWGVACCTAAELHPCFVHTGTGCWISIARRTISTSSQHFCVILT